MNKKTLSSLLTFAIVAIVAVAQHYFSSDKPKAEKRPQPTAQQPTAQQPTSQGNSQAVENVENIAIQKNTPPALPSSLGNYDSVMASDKFGQNKHAPVDYYMLALSWSPAFCDAQRQKNHGDVPNHLAYQCDQKDAFGWVIHGLWPQNAKARSVEDHPRYCQGDLPKVSQATLQKYLPTSPGASLLQGEWEKHGSCAFNTAEEYFAKQQDLYNALALPNKHLRKNDLFQWMRKHNPHLARAYLGASKNELYICYSKNWQVIDCPKN